MGIVAAVYAYADVDNEFGVKSARPDNALSFTEFFL